MKQPLRMSAGTIVIHEGIGDAPGAATVREPDLDEGILEARVADLLERYPEAEELLRGIGIAGQSTGEGSLAGIHRLEVRQALELGGISSSLFLRLLKEMLESRSFRLEM